MVCLEYNYEFALFYYKTVKSVTNLMCQVLTFNSQTKK